MTQSPIRYSEYVAQLPAEWKLRPLRADVQRLQGQQKRKIAVLDDDPTGAQTIHGVYVLTDWQPDLLRDALRRPGVLFYVLTNTRACDAEAARTSVERIAAAVTEAARQVGTDVVFISRGDSTLRGHYPLEMDIVTDFGASGKAYDGHCLIPAFIEAGRVTVGNTQYALDGDALIPVNETEFARDTVFGYKNGHLRQWVEEKTQGRQRASDCVTIGLDTIRQGPEAVAEILLSVEGNVPVIINALTYSDLDVVSWAIPQAEASGKRFAFHCAASFIKSYAGIADQPYLQPERLMAPRGEPACGGLVIIGSHVRKTSRQLAHLLEHTALEPLELEVGQVLGERTRADTLARLAGAVNERIASGNHVVLFSSRQLVAADSPADNLAISQTVSAALVHIVQSLTVAPKFMIAKGGITSSDVATKGLGIRQAWVLGQAAAGIPVWLAGPESKFRGLPLIVFPGNVGADATRTEIVQTLL